MNKYIKIHINESQVHLLGEVSQKDFSYNKDNNSIDFTIPYSPNDEDNDIADTRLFGDPNQILAGKNGMTAKYGNSYRTLESYKRLYDYLLNYQNEYGVASPEMIPNLLKPRSPFMKGLKMYMGEFLNDIANLLPKMFANTDWNGIMRKASALVSKWQTKFEFDKNYFNRAVSSIGASKIPRYRVGIVPGTQLKVISVFKFDSFNISDAIKNGRFRQDDLTDELLGYKDKEKEFNKKLSSMLPANATKDQINQTKKELNAQGYGDAKFFRGMNRKYNGSYDTMTEIPATYDNGVKPIIPNNFSFNQDGNSRVRYGFGGTNVNGNDYNSITQFIDKSIMGAAYAVRKENVSPNFIVSVPSSSNFNVYYCKRLSEKIGVPYLDSFFQKNIIGVTIDKSIYDSGLPTEAIQTLEWQLVSASLNVLSKEVSYPIVYFFKKYSEVFERNKTGIPLDVIIAFIFDKVYDLIRDYASKRDDLKGDVSSLLISKLKKTTKQHSYYDLKSFTAEFDNALQNHQIKTDFNTCVSNVLSTIMAKKEEIVNGVKISRLMSLDRSLNTSYEALDEKLGKLHGNNKKDRAMIQSKFNKSMEMLNKKIKKIVNTDDEFAFVIQEWSPSTEQKRFKATDVKFNVRPYIENAYIIGDDYANCFNHYYNKRFLLFDEDMNSGASLKMTAKVLQNNGVDEEQIVCLVNAYKLEG